MGKYSAHKATKPCLKAFDIGWYFLSKGPFININVLKFRFFFLENVGGWVKGKYRKSKFKEIRFKRGKPPKERVVQFAVGL